MKLADGTRYIHFL